ncbi:MAG: hypothetical protein AAGN82_16045 [Myxococcota bacterium]
MSIGATAACGGSPTAPERDEVYYLHERGVIDQRYSWERYFPPLDRDASPRLPRRVGVAVFDGDVRFSRPIDWYLRTADYTPESRQVSYQSPRQFVFNIYERVDPPRATWDDVLARYEDDVEKAGGEFLSRRIPTATANAQGRSYVVRTPLEAKPAFETYAHEVIVRNDKRIMLIQIIHGESLETSIDEMTQTLKSLRIY